MNKKDFLQLEIPCPELSRQARIASILDTAESAVLVATALRTEVQAQKRGLMQKLLTGDWRLKVEEQQ